MPAFTGTAPGRVNLIGEHLDYNGGRCLPFAIQRRTRATIEPAAGPGHVLHSPQGPEGWSSYPVAMLRALNVRTPLSISVDSDVPMGAGLSSSAALLCSVGIAANAALELGLDANQVATAAIRAESEYLGAPTGGLDQTVCMHAQEGHALLVDFSTGVMSHHRLDLDALDVAVLVIDTGVKHQHLGGGYGDRRSECTEAARLLGMDHLVDAVGDITRLPTTLQRRVRHVRSENTRVLDFVAALAAGDVLKMGELMLDSHLSLRDDYEVSCPELDLAVKVAVHAGALGARMTGGGFGGSAIALVQTRFVDDVTSMVKQAFSRAGYQQPTTFAVRPSQGARI